MFSTHSEALAHLRQILSDQLGPDTAWQLLDTTETEALIRRAFAIDHDATGHTRFTPQPWLQELSQVLTVIGQCEPLPGLPILSGVACPPWCDESNDHPWTLLLDEDTTSLAHLDDGHLTRVHRHRLGDAPTHVAVEMRERAVAPAGPTDHGTDDGALTVAVYLGGLGGQGHLTPNGARRLAAQLLRAADLADVESSTWRTSHEQQP